MNENKPETRTEAAKPAETEHMDDGQKEALDVQADAEHTDGQEREDLTEKMDRLGNSNGQDTE